MSKNYFIDRDCPFCGCDNPKFEKNKFGDGYLVKCPECWAITKVKDTWQGAYDAWNNGEWSEITIKLAENRRNPKNMDDDACLNLAAAIIEGAADDYKWWYRKHLYNKYDMSAKYEVMRIERDIINNPLIHIFTMSGEDIIKEFRRQVEE